MGSLNKMILLLGVGMLTPTGFIHEGVVRLYLEYRIGAAHRLGTRTFAVADVSVVMC